MLEWHIADEHCFSIGHKLLLLDQCHLSHDTFSNLGQFKMMQ